MIKYLLAIKKNQKRYTKENRKDLFILRERSLQNEKNFTVVKFIKIHTLQIEMLFCIQISGVNFFPLLERTSSNKEIPLLTEHFKIDRFLIRWKM